MLRDTLAADINDVFPNTGTVAEVEQPAVKQLNVDKLDGSNLSDEWCGLQLESAEDLTGGVPAADGAEVAVEFNTGFATKTQTGCATLDWDSANQRIVGLIAGVKYAFEIGANCSSGGANMGHDLIIKTSVDGITYTEFRRANEAHNKSGTMLEKVLVRKIVATPEMALHGVKFAFSPQGNSGEYRDPHLSVDRLGRAGTTTVL
jgi:hypothetical protein